jgi:DNA polymerase-1
LILTLDTENTTHAKGNPFSRCNKCCVITYKIDDQPSIAIKWEYDAPLSRDKLALIQKFLDEAELVVGFNLKYDLHWLRRYGLILPKKVWCTQLGQFIICDQQEKYPSLNSSCAYWGLGQKLDVIEKEYWSKGINTDQIPWVPLDEYSRQDVDLTYSLYLKQKEYLRENPSKVQLINLSNQDLMVLEEMEWNGLRFDTELANLRASVLAEQIKEIDATLKGIIGDYPCNFDSSDHKSAILYGGIIKFKIAEPYEHTYKSGQKQGLTEVRYKHSIKEVIFPRLVEPLPDSALAKDGLWSTDQGTLKILRARGKARTIIKQLQERATKEQLLSTYFEGWPKTIQKMDWPEGEVHSNLNQCVVITGRLSSSAPNQQNVPEDVYGCIKTRMH